MNERVGLNRWVIFWAIALGGAAFDLITKTMVFERFGPPSSSPPHAIIPGILEIQTSLNSGALWGLGRTLPYSSQIFGSLSIVAGIGIIYVLFVRRAATSLPLTIALGLIMAGAMGNCYDRLILGQVRDFVHFHVDSINFDCAIFNFADNMLILGAVVLILFALQPEHHSDAPSNLEETQADGHRVITTEQPEPVHPA